MITSFALRLSAWILIIFAFVPLAFIILGEPSAIIPSAIEYSVLFPALIYFGLTLQSVGKSPNYYSGGQKRYLAADLLRTLSKGLILVTAFGIARLAYLIASGATLQTVLGDGVIVAVSLVAYYAILRARNRLLSI